MTQRQRLTLKHACAIAAFILLVGMDQFRWLIAPAIFLVVVAVVIHWQDLGKDPNDPN